MNVTIGFGSIERDFEAAEERAFDEYARLAFAGDEHLVTDEIAYDISGWFGDRASGYRQEADSYKEAEDHPDRYSYYYVTVLHNGSEVVAVVRFSHISRRHPMSSDGWGMIQTKRLFHVSRNDW